MLQSGRFVVSLLQRDHLGNPRILFADVNANNAIAANDIVQTNTYYPYGAPNTTLSTNPSLIVPNDYKYNNKEYLDDLGLNMLDYGARLYDPLTVRWNGVDALAERYSSFSTYGYVGGNPITRIDPDGRDVEVVVTKNPNGIGGTITLKSTIWVMGLNAKARTEELNKVKNNYYHSGTYKASEVQGDAYNIVFDINFAYSDATQSPESTYPENIKLLPGENFVNFMDIKRRSQAVGGGDRFYPNGSQEFYQNTQGDRWSPETGKATGQRFRPDGYDKLVEVGTFYMTTGVFANMGISPEDSSTWGVFHEVFHLLGLTDSYHMNGNPYKGFENDIMGRYGAMGFSQTHYDAWGKYILNQNSNNFILNVNVETPPRTDK